MKPKLTREQIVAKAQPVTESGCWIWIGSLTAKGYGQVSWHGSNEKRAHRLFYELHVGPIPLGVCVLHKCDTPACVNPDHLRLGSKTENAKDRDSRGRMARGERNGRAKVTEADVLAIRASCRPVSELADEYKVNVRDIIKRRTWRHV